MTTPRTPSKRGSPPQSLTPVEALLQANEEILRTKNNLAIAKLVSRIMRYALILGPLVLFTLIVATYFTWRQYDLLIFWWIIGVPAILVLVAVILAAYAREEGQDPISLQLQLALLQERKKVRAAELTLDIRYRRSSYKDDIPGVISDLRAESKFYRRIHNGFQSIIIIGSLATSTITGISLQGGQFRVAAVVTSFLVGLSAGFTGYFKFRERGFYLQQTADAIEQEYKAVELGIGRYRDLSDNDALAAFVAEVERLRTEQQARAQNLDQPPDRTEAPGK
jgi:hypothetical protein